MKHDILLTTPQVLLTTTQSAALLDCSLRWLQRRIKAGVITPHYRSRGRGGSDLLAPVDLLAVAVARELRARGVSLSDAAAVLESLRGRSIDDLRRDIAAGREYLVIIAGRPNAQLSNVDALRSCAADLDGFAQQGHVPTIVNVARALEQVESACRKVTAIAGAAN